MVAGLGGSTARWQYHLCCVLLLASSSATQAHQTNRRPYFVTDHELIMMLGVVASLSCVGACLVGCDCCGCRFAPAGFGDVLVAFNAHGFEVRAPAALRQG